MEIIVIQKNTQEIRQALNRMGYKEAEVFTTGGRMNIDSAPWLGVVDGEYTCDTKEAIDEWRGWFSKNHAFYDCEEDEDKFLKIAASIIDANESLYIFDADVDMYTDNGDYVNHKKGDIESYNSHYEFFDSYPELAHKMSPDEIFDMDKK